MDMNVSAGLEVRHVSGYSQLLTSVLVSTDGVGLYALVGVRIIEPRVLASPSLGPACAQELNNRIATLEAENERFRRAVEQHLSEKEELSKQLEALSQENDSLETSLGWITVQNDILQGQLSDLQENSLKEIEALKTQRDRLVQVISKDKARFTKEIKKLNTDLQRAEQQAARKGVETNRIFQSQCVQLIAQKDFARRQIVFLKDKVKSQARLLRSQAPTAVKIEARQDDVQNQSQNAESQSSC